MSRSLTMTALLAAALAVVSCATSERAGDPLLREPERFEAGSACPLIADGCPAGCFHVGAEPVDVKNACLLPPQKWGCSGAEIGPPAMECSVTPDGRIWISRDNRRHPDGRPCTMEEREAINYPRCG